MNRCDVTGGIFLAIGLVYVLEAVCSMIAAIVRAKLEERRQK